MGGGMGEEKDSSVLLWLTGTAATDLNFKRELERANRATVEAALEHIDGLPGNRIREKALRQRLEQLAAEPMPSNQTIVDTANRQQRTTELELATLQADREFETAQVELQGEKERNIAEAYETAGMLKGLNFVKKVVTVAEIVRLDLVKKSKGYKGIGTWDDYCKYVDLDRHSIDQQLKALNTFGEDFLVTISNFGLGYREMRRLRQLAGEGVIEPREGEIAIAGEVIPIDTDHTEVLRDAIDHILTSNARLAAEVEKLTKKKDSIVAAETKALKAEKEMAVNEYQRLKLLMPDDRDRDWSVKVLGAIAKDCSDFTLAVSKFILDPRLKGDRKLEAQIDSHITEMEMTLKDLRDRFESEHDIYGD